MIAVIRLRGSMKIKKDIGVTLEMLRLKRVNTLSLLPDNKVTMGMIRKVDDFVAWGTISDDLLQKFGDQKVVRLKPPKGGLKSVKVHYPRGNVGYNGDAINDLIKRMM